jgi:hypothetical protein
VILAAALLLVGSAAPSWATAQVAGSGVLRRPGGAQALVSVESVDGQPLMFSYQDRSNDPPRTLTFTDTPLIECRGERFGGLAVSLTGPGSDNTAPGEAVTLEVYLVDGGEAGPDLLSVKTTRADGTIRYLAGLAPLDSGDLTVGC